MFSFLSTTVNNLFSSSIKLNEPDNNMYMFIDVTHHERKSIDSSVNNEIIYLYCIRLFNNNNEYVFYSQIEENEYLKYEKDIKNFRNYSSNFKLHYEKPYFVTDNTPANTITIGEMQIHYILAKNIMNLLNNKNFVSLYTTSKNYSEEEITNLKSSLKNYNNELASLLQL